MKRMARNLTDAVDGFFLKHRYIIMDRDPLFCHGFRDNAANSGRVVRRKRAGGVLNYDYRKAA